MADRRMPDEPAIRTARAMLLAALITNRIVAYAVEHDGATYTALGYQRSDGAVPLALLLPADQWLASEQQTDVLFAARRPPAQWN